MDAADARLDGKGVLLVDPGNEVKDAEWIGEVCGEEDLEIGEEAGQTDRVTLFESVRIGDEIVSVGDSVYLTPENQGEPCEMGRVASMFETNETGEKHLSVQWFWRPEHIVMPKSMLFDEKEVFLSDTIDHNPIEAFESKCTVIQLRESDAVTAAVRTPHVFFYRRTYDPAHQSFAIAKGSEPVANLVAAEAFPALLPPALAGKGSGSKSKTPPPAAAAPAASTEPMAASAASSAPHAASAAEDALGDVAMDDAGGAPDEPPPMDEDDDAPPPDEPPHHEELDADATQAPPLDAMRRLQDHLRRVRNEAKDVQKELSRIDKAALRDVLRVVDAAREKHASLLKAVDALESQVSNVSNLALDGLGFGDGHAEAVSVEAEDDDDDDDDE